MNVSDGTIPGEFIKVGTTERWKLIQFICLSEQWRRSLRTPNLFSCQDIPETKPDSTHLESQSFRTRNNVRRMPTPPSGCRKILSIFPLWVKLWRRPETNRELPEGAAPAMWRSSDASAPKVILSNHMALILTLNPVGQSGASMFKVVKEGKSCTWNFQCTEISRQHFYAS